MTPQCEPTESAEDGSLHWVEHEKYGKRVWAWSATASSWSPNEEIDDDLVGITWLGWRYLHPASPTADADPSATTAELSRLRTTIEAQSVMLQDSSAALAMVTKGRDAAREDSVRLDYMITQSISFTPGFSPAAGRRLLDEWMENSGFKAQAALNASAGES